MSPFDEVLELARRQAAAAARDDLDEAVRLLEQRAELLASAGPAAPTDADAIAETLRLDRELSSALRERMLRIRDEALALQRGRTAVSGYRPPRSRRPRMIDSER